ncbi:NepR family anti-sigma factor [Methylobacterium frigidaeris]|uniref:Anti-sigma factor NepR domain-containing protein n=2 Tax=Methylobacterium frigidaeris TaxID=2038277 RepID=A0AA37H8H8_9HYPH|nr:NepR family anti-sigma factor [Methylobacterium frigidaeris]PIK70570.1 hypothetical protein CS379_23920 [Methylobacterium frigidaeris]GJD60904.1 hypothetical protein MPEAHAMD_1044 [Methylobacterium frigidaeris]
MIEGKGMQGPRAPREEDDPAAGPEQPALDRNVQGRIGSHLRAMYDELMQQPIPDRFVDLIAELERNTTPMPTETPPTES